MKPETRDYKLIDFFRIPLSYSKGTTLLIMLEKLISSLVPTIQIALTAYFIDCTIGIFRKEYSKGKIVLPIGSILFLLVYQYMIPILIGLIKTKLSLKLTETYRVTIVEKRASLEYKHVEDNETRNLIERVGKDPVEHIMNGFDILLQLIGIVIRVGSLLVVISYEYWWAGLATIVCTIPLFWLAIQSGKRTYRASQETAKFSRRYGYLQEVLTGRNSVEERSLFSYSEHLENTYLDTFMAAYKIDRKAQSIRFIKMKSASLITVIITIVIAGILLFPLKSGNITIGLFTMIVNSTFDLAQLISWNLTNFASELANHREYLRDLTLFFHLSETSCAQDLPSIKRIEPACIEFRNVSFAYPNTDKMILNNLNLKLYADKSYAFVGCNGAGKTTITKLLTGMYDNYTGEILIDDVELRSLSQSELKSLFTVVYQDFAKYQISIADNIRLGNVNGTNEADIEKAIELIGLKDEISRLPEGKNTSLGKIMKEGIDFSGGQWQRIAIARSLISPASVHILDEPTAALDPVLESEIYKIFREISKKKTTIFITHRLGAARLAEKIIVIANGSVAEQGTHEQLMSLKGIYADMYETQRGWYE